MGLIGEILPPLAFGCESFGHVAEADLFPEEAAAIAAAVPRRRAEFATVRQCARAALSELGVPLGPIVPDSSGAPRWPSGVVGSMTHCPGYCAAVVAPASAVRGLGIDAEPHLALPAGVCDLVASDRERSHLDGLSQVEPEIRYDRLLFCAKEAIYKLWFPVARTWLGFDEVTVSIDLESRRFVGELQREASARGSVGIGSLHGRWLVADGFILAVTALDGQAGDRR